MTNKNRLRTGTNPDINYSQRTIDSFPQTVTLKTSINIADINRFLSGYYLISSDNTGGRIDVELFIGRNNAEQDLASACSVAVQVYSLHLHHLGI